MDRLGGCLICILSSGPYLQSLWTAQKNGHPHRCEWPFLKVFKTGALLPCFFLGLGLFSRLWRIDLDRRGYRFDLFWELWAVDLEDLDVEDE